jgi:hypothetical protein
MTRWIDRIIEQSSRLLITQDFQDDMSSLIRFCWCWTLLVTTLVRLSPAALTGKYFYFLITVAALTFPSQETDRGETVKSERIKLLVLMIWLKRNKKNKATDGEEPEPEFIDQIGNVTIAQGRDAILSCSVAHLNDYTVRTCTYNLYFEQWEYGPRGRRIVSNRIPNCSLPGWLGEGGHESHSGNWQASGDSKYSRLGREYSRLARLETVSGLFTITPCPVYTPIFSTTTRVTIIADTIRRRWR